MIWLDTETFSETPLGYGTYRYAENCEVDIVAIAIDDGPVTVYDTANVIADRQTVRDILLGSDDTVVAHNVMFDRNVLRLGNLKIDVPIPRWRCSMVRAYAHGLPGSLDQLGEVMNIHADQRKLKEGKQLMHLFCKPHKFTHSLNKADFSAPKAYTAAVAAAKAAWTGRLTKVNHPVQWALYLAYAGNDVEAMRAICKKLPAWNYTFEPPSTPPKAADIEVALWHLDQVVNDRGFAVDLDLVSGALAAVEKEQLQLAEDCTTQTRGMVTAATQRDKLLDFILQEHGIYLDNLRGATVDKMLENSDLAPELRDLLRIRSRASTSSTAKYKSLQELVTADGRGKGTLQFDGAARTRRACLAAGSLVLVKTRTGDIDEKPIEAVQIDDMVWDGFDWVTHEGVVPSGEKEVFTHDSVTATLEHIVWLDESTSCSLAEAISKGLPLWRGNSTSFTR